VAYLQYLPIDERRDGELTFCAYHRAIGKLRQRALYKFWSRANTNGLLIPNAHYVPVKEDLSDLADLLEFIKDKKRVGDITN
jgi:hypothetical protein